MYTRTAAILRTEFSALGSASGQTKPPKSDANAGRWVLSQTYGTTCFVTQSYETIKELALRAIVGYTAVVVKTGRQQHFIFDEQSMSATRDKIQSTIQHT